MITAFLFAMETSQTIGYGSRYPYSECPYGAEATATCVNYQAKVYEEKTRSSPSCTCSTSRGGFQIDGLNYQIPLLWPLVVSHRIGKDSPLYRMDNI